MSDPIDQEIRILRAIFWSERDPEGRAFVPLADAYLRKGSPEEALSLLEDGLGRHPDFSSAHLVAARTHRARGEAERAERSLAAVLELDPGNASALRMKGELAEAEGRIEEAVEAFQKALAGNPGYGDLPGRIERLAAGMVGTPPFQIDDELRVEAPSPDPFSPDPPSSDDAPAEEASFAVEGPDDEAEALSPIELPDPFADLALGGDESPDPEVGGSEASEAGPFGEATEASEVGLEGGGEWEVEIEEADDDLEPLAFADFAVGEFPPDSTMEATSEEVTLDPAVLEELDAISEPPEETAPASAADASGHEDEGADADDGQVDAEEVSFEPMAELPPSNRERLDAAAAHESLARNASAFSTAAPDADAPGSPAPPIPPAPSPPERPESVDAVPLTRTLAELYARQGLTEQAVEVYEVLVHRTPSDPSLRARLDALRHAADADGVVPADDVGEEAGEGEGAVTMMPEPPSDDGRPEADAEPQPRTPPVKSRAELGRRPVGSYFADLLAWAPGAIPVEHLAPDSAAPLPAAAAAADSEEAGSPVAPPARPPEPSPDAHGMAPPLDPPERAATPMAPPAAPPAAAQVASEATETPPVVSPEAVEAPLSRPEATSPDARPPQLESSEPAPPEPPTPSGPAAPEEDAFEGLDDFQDWLRSLNR